MPRKINRLLSKMRLIQDEIKKKREYVDMVRSMFVSIDKADEGKISWETFFHSLHEPNMLAFLSRLELDVLDVAQFFEILSDDGQCLVDMDTFVMGCIKMRGSAKSMDLLGLINKQHKEMHVKSIVFLHIRPLSKQNA